MDELGGENANLIKMGIEGAECEGGRIFGPGRSRVSSAWKSINRSPSGVDSLP
ncbi:MAG: hypothetical protein ACYDCH_10880 [Gaiellaceae bacterium]